MRTDIVKAQPWKPERMMSEAERLALINNAPLILTALGTLVSAIMGLWSVIVSKSTKKEVDGGLSKMLAALEAVHRAEIKAARAEALGEAALQTSTAPTVVVPPAPRGVRATDQKPDPER